MVLSKQKQCAGALFLLGRGVSSLSDARLPLSRRVALVAGSALVWPSPRSSVAAFPDRDGTEMVVLDVNGRAQAFPSRPLPVGFDKGLELKIRDISALVFQEEDFPAEWPYTAQDMKRLDESDDGSFYDAPRLVYHIDGGAVAALTHYYAANPPKGGSDILDICSSWVSHYPPDFPARMGKISGTGMNGLELGANKQLTGGFVASDLNKETKLPFPDQSFDMVTCVVSVDYLNKPREVFREVHRVLRPGGRFVLSQSNRLFYSKAVAKWLALDDYGRLELIGDYFHYAGGFGPPRAFDISAKGKGAKDPMYIVEATKLPSSS